MTVRGPLETLRLLRKLYRMERSSPGRSFAPDLWIAGFFSQRRELYPFKSFDRRWFLTDWEIESRLGLVNDAKTIPLLDNKLLFNLILAHGPLAGALPRLVGMVANGSFRSLGPYATLAQALQDQASLISKPVDGAGGTGVTIVREEGDLPREGTFLVEERIRQHEYAERIFPDSLNTIRVVTMTDRDGREAIIAGAAHRFGCARSAPVDNFKRGGLSALVDLETGRLSAGRTNPGLHASSLHARHPETGEAVAGVTVPHWNEAKAMSLKLARLFPGLYHVGWDICITAQGPRLIEGNSRLANPNLIQAHAPILLDPKIRDFLRRHGVLSARRARRLES